jgi:hypothetical protein
MVIRTRTGVSVDGFIAMPNGDERFAERDDHHEAEALRVMGRRAVASPSISATPA